MNQKPKLKRGWRPPSELTPSESETQAVRKNFSALKRIAGIAAQAGANDEDIVAAKVWPLLWAWEVVKRHELEPLAEIGRKVRYSRSNEDRSEQRERDFQIVSCACRMGLAGVKPRGLATKIRNELNIDLSVRHINRILDYWMPIILFD